MYSILKDLYAVETNQLFTPRKPSPVTLSQDLKELQTYDVSKQYKLTVEIHTVFNVKKGFFDRAFEHAKRNVAKHIYGDFLDDINRIVSAVYSDDGEEVLDICKAIREKVYNFKQ